MRLLLVPALALFLAGAPAVQAADDAVAPIAVALGSNTNVRFGPSKTAKMVVTLKAGTAVEVFGPAKSAPEWFVVRFPKEGRVWVHSKNLKALDGGQRYQVTADRTRARSDATLSADVVAELSAGEVVEDKGNVVGDWRAVNIPDAVAYIHGSLISLPPDVEAKIIDRQKRAAAADQVWQQALATYAKHLELVKASPKAAVGLDWAGLAAQLDTVITDHASASVKTAATRVRESIAALLPPAQKVAEQEGVKPPAAIAEKPAAPTAPAGEKPAAGTAAAQPEAAPGLTPEQVRVLTEAKAAAWQAEGLLDQDDAYLAKVGTRDVLIDQDGKVVAFIKAKDGVDLKLSELQGRYVGAKGEVLTVPAEQSGLPGPTRLITATEVAPYR